MEETASQNNLSKDVHVKGSIKEVVVAQKEELRKIGAPR